MAEAEADVSGYRSTISVWLTLKIDAWVYAMRN
jgi:hypothetical protein